METEVAIEASREAIKVCFMVGGPILAVCLVVGVLMGVAQAMSSIQDQALATVPKILAILAVIGFGLPWFADHMMEYAQDQFRQPFVATAYADTAIVESDLAEIALRTTTVSHGSSDSNYYPALDVPRLKASGVEARQASYMVPVETEDLQSGSLNRDVTIPALRREPAVRNRQSTDGPVDSSVDPNPFQLPRYRYSRRSGEDQEG